MFRDVSPEGPDWGSWPGPADRGSQPKRKHRHSDDSHSGVQVPEEGPGDRSKDRDLTTSPILVQAFQFMQTFMSAARRLVRASATATSSVPDVAWSDACRFRFGRL